MLTGTDRWGVVLEVCHLLCSTATKLCRCRRTKTSKGIAPTPKLAEKSLMWKSLLMRACRYLLDQRSVISSRGISMCLDLSKFIMYSMKVDLCRPQPLNVACFTLKDDQDSSVQGIRLRLRTLSAGSKPAPLSTGTRCGMQ